MYLDKLKLKNYRNYENVDTTFSPDINVFLGANAQGKTNLLESIYVLAMTKSHRTSNNKELIRWGTQFAKIDGTVVKETGSLPLELILSHQGKRAKVNRLDQAKLSQYIGKFNVILFAPEDLAIVKGAPMLRRRFIDMEFGQMSPKYLYALTNYQAILKQRNHYLKMLQQKKASDQLYLNVITEQLIEYGAQVVVARQEFLQRMEHWAQEIHKTITLDQETLTFAYKSQVPTEALTDVKAAQAALQELFEKHRQREIEQGTTLVGPQRDDVVFLINDKNVQNFGSQGQQRTVALSVKLAEIDLMKELTGEYPVLLLDDVLSELDDARQTHLLKTIQHKVQTFLTTTSLDGVAQDIIQNPRIFHIEAGQITTD
ncbi:recF protein [Lactobacillus selangorensis]|uniref:DNA replication and repair protein RecF n=1 Tax=Lactobacillus selangorensis TaxID=81857 RepID=A0A0R2G8R3_9LACO|nr:DNA replication/repair protein RecF [Lactobacillus selangorensis]KRN28617.1 recF protein [Lactobacillus selangorensis]KRN32973.1 recF protein [Lactobacillus selangorensis]